MAASMEMWRSKLNSKYSKQDIDNWDAKFKAELKHLKQQVDNKRCFDCNSEDVTWASPKLGIFICVTCSDVHRAAGAHITCVKNFNTYLWGPDEVALMKAVGNTRGRQLYGQEVVSSSADKCAKVAYCTRKYGNDEVHEIVAREVISAKAAVETRKLDARSIPSVAKVPTAQSQQVRVQGCNAQNLLDDLFFSEPVVETTGKDGHRDLTQTAEDVDWFADLTAKTTTPARKETELEGSLVDFLAACNPVVEKAAGKTRPDVDFFAGWESWE